MSDLGKSVAEKECNRGSLEHHRGSWHSVVTQVVSCNLPQLPRWEVNPHFTGEETDSEIARNLPVTTQPTKGKV